MDPARRQPFVVLGLVVGRCLVAFGAACAGVFAGYMTTAIVIVPTIGSARAPANLAWTIAAAVGVAAAVASLAVPVRPGWWSGDATAEDSTGGGGGVGVMATVRPVIDLREWVSAEDERVDH